MSIIREVNQLKRTPLSVKVNKRLKEFESFQKKSSKHWFSELCFCILTANSRAETALKIQSDLGAVGFCECKPIEVKKTIQKHKHRFHNNKTKYICEAREHIDIKNKLKHMIETEAREWLVKNIKGLGYKEASHFLRNIGYKNLSILDRHIINLMVEDKKISRPKTLTKKNYLEIEKDFLKLTKKTNTSAAELDLYMWYMKTGEVLK